MRQSLKISLSLLIALVLFAVFSVLAFRGGFDRLQASFFQPQVLRERGEALAAAVGSVLRYHQRNVERFGEVLREPYIAGAFSATGQQSRQDIFNRGNLFGKLLEEYPNLLGVRFLDPDGERVHFSTFPQDSSYSSDRKSVTYLDFSKSEPGLKGWPLVVRAGDEPRLLVDGGGGRFLYSLPVNDARGTYRGAALFFVSARDLESALAREPGSAASGLLLVDRLGILVGFPQAARELILSSVASAWAGRAPTAEGQDTLQFEGPAGISRYLLLSRPAGPFGLVGWLVPYSAIELQPLLKIILLAAVLLTVFLVVFLVFNIRQDQQLLLARRIKRFQLDVLAELIEGKERLDWQRWRNQLAANRLALRSRFKRGMGRIPAGKEAEVDGLIDRGWDEIIGIIEARLGESGREKVAVSQIEEMIQKALDRGRFTVAGTLPAAAAGLPAAAPGPRLAAPGPPVESQPKKPAPARRESLVVEEIGVEEVSELAEAGPEPAIAAPVEEEAAPGAPAAAGPDMAEEVDELEAVEETAPAVATTVNQVEEAEEAEEAEEVGEAEEAEEAEEVEEVGEAEEVEEIGEAEELEETASGRQPAVAARGREPAAAAPAAAAPAAGDAEEILEEIVEEVGLEPAREAFAREPAIAALPAAATASAPPAIAELEPAVAAPPIPAESAVEELEIVGEIVPLPPEQQEKLEELPQFEEPAPAVARPKAVPSPGPEEPLETLEVLEEAVEEQAGPAPAAELRSVEAEPRVLQELLESPEALELEERTAEVEPADELAQLDRLMEQGILQAYSLTEFEAQIRELRTSVVMENGVFKVKEEVRRAQAPGAAAGRGLMALAEAALSAGEEESGIGALLSAGPGVDLSEELGSSSARGGFPTYADLRRAKRMHFSNGLDYDQYLLQFRVGVSETGALRSLVEISRKLKAVNAALLIKTGEAYVSRLRIGLLEKPARILFSAGELFYDRFLSRRQSVLLNGRPQAIPSLAARFNPEDLKYMQMALFLPTVYQKTEAVLFFGLPVKRPLELKAVIQALDIHL